ncbi:chromosome segregation protein SMC [Candidatus Neomarinimicrobiota bacterium]
MYISSLVLNGFKSFGRKTTVQLGEGITAVVGPNGCGKTNIVDALRWVLGEQKQSVLRSIRMEEIIFNGSKNLKASSMCEATLTIHNDKSKLPVEYTDIEITRRLYRDGESEYLINRTPCRRKDILDLFMDTGMGSDAYSVIELKMIEAILSELGEDRRRMFEEAAGINRYKKQRASTHRKLEATRQDLERVNDIIGEVDTKVRGLGLQLKRFERYKRLSNEIKDTDILLAKVRITDLREKIKPLSDTITSGSQTQDDGATAIAKDEGKLSELRQAYEIREQALSKVRIELAEVVEQLNRSQRDTVMWQEQLHSNQALVERAGGELEQITESKAEAVKESAKISQELEQLRPDLEKLQKLYQDQQAEEETVVIAFKHGEERLQSVREKKFNHFHLIQEEESRRQRSADLIGEKQQDREKIEETLAERKKQLEILESSRVQLVAERVGKEQALAELAVSLDDIETKLFEFDDQEALLRDRYHSLTTRVKVLQSRQEILDDLAASHDGYPAGTRKILSLADQFEGVVGTVADSMEVDQIYAHALETALGSFATCLIIEDEAQATAILAYARDHDLGRLSLIPLNAIKATKPSESDPVGTPLIDLIKVAPDLGKLYRHLLAGISWVDSKATLSPGATNGQTVVTGEGHLIGDIPVLTHLGHQVDTDNSAAGSASATIVGRTAELEVIRKTISETTEQVELLDEQLKILRTKRDEFTARKVEDGKATDENLSTMNKTTRELGQVEYEIKRLKDDIDDMSSQAPALTELLGSMEKSLAAADQLIEKLNGQSAGLDANITQAEESFSKVSEERDRWRDALQELRLKLVNLENQRTNLAERQLNLGDTIAAAEARMVNLQNELTKGRENIGSLGSKLAAGKEQITQLTEKSESQKLVAREQETETGQLRDEVGALEAKIRAQQHDRQEALARQKDVELELVRLQQDEEQIRARIEELYEVELEPEFGDIDREQSDELAEELTRKKVSLERIGPINMAAADEYEEESKRLEFLTEQRSDLLEAEDSLMETIEKVDTKAREQFRETYDQIRYHFKQTFSLFFAGGEGDLRLIGDPDPLEANIEIYAQPPGKKSRSLRSLSAGEKALTAIALLFAIYQVKPSPFCILDEVDAPLDDTNINKFISVIHQFARETQFIVVTHNKLTMERANFLYGVTMKEEGLSTVVSVALNDYE